MANTEKIVRLLAEGRVAPVAQQGHLEQFAVVGDTGSYTTVVGATVAMCTCKRWRSTMERCTHIEAVVRRVNASPEELRLLDEAIKVRKAAEAAKADEAFARLGA